MARTAKFAADKFLIKNTSDLIHAKPTQKRKHRKSTYSKEHLVYKFSRKKNIKAHREDEEAKTRRNLPPLLPSDQGHRSPRRMFPRTPVRPDPRHFRPPALELTPVLTLGRPRRGAAARRRPPRSPRRSRCCCRWRPSRRRPAWRGDGR